MSVGDGALTGEPHDEEFEKADNHGEVSIADHDTLKYHLLGPSLTKAGQESVNQQEVSEIIYNASKGSKFFNNEEVKDRSLTQKISRILAKKRQLDGQDMRADLRRADEYIAQLELSRDLSQIVVHIDCDAFYAAVEELDRPELRDVPMAVGKGVLTTCNYHARKFGCRSGMAGFVAMKLCPQLICLPLNFEKYTSKAEEVRAILAEYDPRFESASIDEAYLNITNYCAEWQQDAEEVVAQIRAEVLDKTKITISAGIAANGKLAKICSNKNKPNGQFFLPSDRTTILEFMRELPTRKVNGIGRVFERELDAIGIKSCGDIYPQRAYLSRLFGQKAFQFLMNCYLGLGRTRIQPAEEYERKSVGTESTFRDISDKQELREKLRWIAEELEKDLRRTQFKGYTLVLKIKLHTYEVFTRQSTPPKAIYLANDLYKYSLPMLVKLEKEMPGLRLRLMGLRVTHIVSMKKDDSNFFQRVSSIATVEKKDTSHWGLRDNDEQWEVWPEAEFEEAARQERLNELKEVEALSQEHESKSQIGSASVCPQFGRDRKETVEPQECEQRSDPSQASVPERGQWKCPICGRPQIANDRAFNEHIDFCLSRQTIQKAVEDTILQSDHGTGSALLSGSKAVEMKKRGREDADIVTVVTKKAQKRLFFGENGLL